MAHLTAPYFIKDRTRHDQVGPTNTLNVLLKPRSLHKYVFSVILKCFRMFFQKSRLNYVFTSHDVLHQI